MSVTRSRPRGTLIEWELRKLFASGSVRAGVLAGATYPADTLTNAATGQTMPDPREGMPVATIAMGLEYGHSQAHPRPFIHKTVSEQGKAWAAILTGAMRQGRPAADALLLTGHVMAEDITNTILDWPADNSESWAAFKGFNHGLVATGHLSRSISSEVDSTD